MAVPAICYLLHVCQPDAMHLRIYFSRVSVYVLYVCMYVCMLLDISYANKTCMLLGTTTNPC